MECPSYSSESCFAIVNKEVTSLSAEQLKLKIEQHGHEMYQTAELVVYPPLASCVLLHLPIIYTHTACYLQNGKLQVYLQTMGIPISHV